jgi:hypothetical protein
VVKGWQLLRDGWMGREGEWDTAEVHVPRCGPKDVSDDQRTTERVQNTSRRFAQHMGREGGKA